MHFNKEASLLAVLTENIAQDLAFVLSNYLFQFSLNDYMIGPTKKFLMSIHAERDSSNYPNLESILHPLYRLLHCPNFTNYCFHCYFLRCCVPVGYRIDPRVELKRILIMSPHEWHITHLISRARHNSSCPEVEPLGHRIPDDGNGLGYFRSLSRAIASRQRSFRYSTIIVDTRQSVPSS